ncbi:MAG: signal transduction histidine kinase [Paracoccaceae bacterium]|jgi:signal transduction histidine kinase
MRQAVSNLVSNGVKFSNPNGTVIVSSEISSNREIILSIADEGIGIHPKDLIRVMEPFEQADNRLSRKFEGMGLGLPLSRAIIQLHGGELSLISEPERGTVATITLPISRRIDEDGGEINTESHPRRG